MEHEQRKKRATGYLLYIRGFRVLPSYVSYVGDYFHKTDKHFLDPVIDQPQTFFRLFQAAFTRSSPKVERCSRDLSSLCCWHALGWEALEPGWKKKHPTPSKSSSSWSDSGKRR